MSNELSILVSTVIGGLLTIAGIVINNLIQGKKEARATKQTKRNEAYLLLIDAILEIDYDDANDEIIWNAYKTKYAKARPYIRLYGSENIIETIKGIDGKLFLLGVDDHLVDTHKLYGEFYNAVELLIKEVE